MKMNQTSALCAETSHCEGVLTTSTLGLPGYGSTAATLLSSQDSLGFYSLADICRLIRRSKSWIYEHGIVPLLDNNGHLIDGGKQPPFPWLPLPPPCVDQGKRLWAKEDVDRWILSIRERARRSNDASQGHAHAYSEVSA
jgi:hypothetical protein